MRDGWADLLLPFLLFTKASWEEMFLRSPSGCEWTISVTPASQDISPHVGEISALGQEEERMSRIEILDMRWQRRVVCREETICHYRHRTHSLSTQEHITLKKTKKTKFNQLQETRLIVSQGETEQTSSFWTSLFINFSWSKLRPSVPSPLPQCPMSGARL